MKTKPYRLLVVVETWGDPASQVINETDSFQPVAALLKAWSVPFDILRLDQQKLGASYLFDRSGAVRYGTTLWRADSASYTGKNLQTLTEAADLGTSVIVASSRFADPVFERILGLKYRADYRAADPLLKGTAHFITRDTVRESSNEYGSHGIWVESQDHIWMLEPK